ncbi:MAG: c-type cytochrome [Plesiomonas sp.]|uniref:c-type cytochrome n=1 Tax=Plesiomonas sp. TaxID=2486279 RepID=UPI003F2D0AE9
MKSGVFFALLLAVSSSGAALAAEGNIEAGKTLSASCASCHGKAGIAAIPIYPSLAGQNEAYLDISMRAYRDGDRTGGMTSMMTPLMESMTDQQLADLAAYYASLKGK